MKLQVIREIKLDDKLPEPVKHEILRVTRELRCEKWLSKYIDACVHLNNEGVIEYRRNDLFKLADEWIKSGREVDGRELQWATSNLWWATTFDGLVSMLQYVADEWRSCKRAKDGNMVAWLSDNIPWGKRKIVTYGDLENLASKLAHSGREREGQLLLTAHKEFPSPKDPLVAATLNTPWHRVEGESHLENPSVLLVMLLEGKS